MNYSVTLYTKPSCHICESVKQLLSTHNVTYQEIVIGRDISRQEVIEKFPQARIAPIIIVNGIESNPSSLQLLLETNNYDGPVT